MNATDLLTAAKDALAEAMKSPTATPADIVKFKSDVALAEAAVELDDARRERRQADAKAEAERHAENNARHLAAEKAAAIKAAQREASLITDELTVLQSRLDALLAMPGVTYPVPMKVIVVKPNANFSSTVAQATVHSIHSALNIELPDPNAAARHASVVEANRAALAQSEKFRLASTRSEPLAEISPRQPAKVAGKRVNIFGDVLN